MSTITGLPVQLKDKNGDVIFPLTNNFPKDTIPTSASVNILDSGAIYDALQFKSDLNHTHQISNVDNLESALNNKADLEHTQPISSIINLENTLSVKADLNHTHTQFDNVSVNQGLNIASGLNLFMTATSANLTTLKKMEDVGSIYDGSTNGTHYYWLDVRDNDNNSFFQERVIKYTDGFKVLFRFPASATYGGGGSLSVLNSKNFAAPLLEWGTATQGHNSELTRVDWVKERVRDYSMPDYYHGVYITSSWPASGWTNNRGNGFLEICIKDGNSIPITRATLYDTSIGSGARLIHSPAIPTIESEMKVYHVPVISRTCL